MGVSLMNDLTASQSCTYRQCEAKWSQSSRS